MRRRPQFLVTLISSARSGLQWRGAVPAAPSRGRGTAARAWSAVAGTWSMRTLHATKRSGRKRILSDAALAPIAQIVSGRAMMRRQLREQHDTSSSWAWYALQEPVNTATPKYRELQPS